VPSLKAIRKRIGSVKNTRKITRAMKLVSGAKLRRAQNAMQELKPYAQKHRDLLRTLAAQLGEGGRAPHPLMQAREQVRRVAILALSSDRGMCGGFNAGIQRKLDRYVRERSGEVEQIVVFPVGRRISLYTRKGKTEVGREFGEILGATSNENVRLITGTLVRGFLEEQFDEVLILRNEFRSALSQVPVIDKLLPITADAAGEAATPADEQTDVLYEPSREALLGYVVPRYVEVQVRHAILESIAGEHAARMNAMSNATDNASAMIESLTLQMNRARQAAITKELMEIIGGAESMK
jgi:F-type H+-transporting ATPase subunit gamma